MIELLTAVTILMIIVSIMGVIFAESDRAWTQGTSMVESNTEGRAALNMLSHDLQYAIADGTLTFTMRPDREGLVTFNRENSEICFVSLSQRPETSGSGNARATQQIFYYLEEKTHNDKVSGIPLGRFQLMRTAINTDIPGNSSAYDNPLWYEQGANDSGRGTFHSTAVIAENVVALQFFAPCFISKDPRTGVKTWTTLQTYNSDVNELNEGYDNHNDSQLPAYVDVVLEIMGEKDAIRAADLADRLSDVDPKVLDFVEKQSRRYTTRVYLKNRAGYRKRT